MSNLVEEIVLKRLPYNYGMLYNLSENGLAAKVTEVSFLINKVLRTA